MPRHHIDKIKDQNCDGIRGSSSGESTVYMNGLAGVVEQDKDVTFGPTQLLTAVSSLLKEKEKEMKMFTSYGDNTSFWSYLDSKQRRTPSSQPTP